MGTHSNVIWVNGAVRPQNFQQQQRYYDYLLSHHLNFINNYFYGFSTLELNREFLRLGRIGLSSALGLMPDGTLFDIPFQDQLPDPIEIKKLDTAESHNIYLVLPNRSESVTAIDLTKDNKMKETRYVHDEINVRDIFSKNGEIREVPIAKLSPRLMQGSDDLSAYTVLPVCRIKEKKADGTLVLDENFIPTCNSISVSYLLYDFLSEVAGLITERAKQLSQRISAPQQQGIADVAEFLMLQLFNRTKPIFIHLTKRTSVHPEDLYRQLVLICGELMTFTDESRVSPLFEHYNHDDLTTTFYNLMLITRRALSTVLTPRAVSIQLSKRSHGVFDGVIHDKALLRTADFILAVKARVPQETLLRSFVQQTKVSTPNRIREIVSIQVSGIPLKALSAAPSQLPHHSGYTYFQLDTNAPAWEEIIINGAIAFHVSGDFPELDMQFWAIRGKS
ncbi:type VI secretion system-associated protein [Gilliamella sp. Fer2-1]|jgi:type VI secretion system protein ImpJ|nr:type VI secretion system-associated protein [Gilliamella apicola]